MDGYITIGTELDTKSFDKQIEEVETKLNEIDFMLSHQKELKLKSRDVKELNLEAEKLNNKLFDLRKKQDALNNRNVFEGIGKGIENVIKKVAKWSLAVIGLRSVYLGIRSAMSTLSQYDDGLSAKTEYLRWALANSIKPIIEWIIDALYKIMGFVGKIIYNISGKNIFENSGIGDYEKALKNSNKSAKDLKKTLAGFDEMNVLNADGKTGIGNKLPTKEYDLSKDIKKENQAVKQATKLWFKFGDAMEDILKDRSAFDNAFGYFGSFFYGIIQFIQGLWNVIEGFIEFIGGTLDIVVGLFTFNGEKIKSGISYVGSGIWKIISGIFEAVVGLLQTLVGLIIGLIAEVWSGIKGLFKLIFDTFKSMIDNIIGIISTIAGLVNDYIIKPIINLFAGLWNVIKTGASNAWNGVYSIWNGVANWFNNILINPIKNFFGGMWNGLIDGAKNAWEGIKSVFSVVATWFRNIFSNAWQGVINVFRVGSNIFVSIKDAIVNAFKWIVNGLIDGINNVISIPFNGINSAFDGLRGVDLWGWKPFEWVPRFNVPQIPHLAKGGILNNPGRGVYTGNAIAGEAGKEFYMPLQDEQMLSLVGEAIGKYVNINLTNITELDGRQIARKVEQINNNNRFVLNR